ncbi:aldose 1-epimerase family protein [Sphingomonas sp. SUN039]|uniref:aldose 1-epimerase family protein n=1 Tax=Sphingomonas sp. SUN039 TaxID=2937787 RepID=UPI002164C103|nr:aldose 1-epimerase family protein [Sphingomonas sp. SUN039]UVO55161.1 aldose 1-epimerase family protein [Sphingomonas sp. SUN039]
MIGISSGALTARIDPQGAELQSLTDVRGREYMSSGDPAFWSGRAPLLFPIVGRLNDDMLRVDGQSYTLEKHGFARRVRFEVVAHDASSVRFRLTDSPATRAMYPFAFTLDVLFAVAGDTLAMTVIIRNPGNAPLPASFGYHPAFAWPLPGAERAAHEVVFECDEPAPLRRVTPEGLIGPDPKPSPVDGNSFALTDALFADDALVWTDLDSRRLSYGVPDGPHLDIAFPDTPHLGIWTKPGAAFVCIEPWAGHADPEGYSGDFRDKPGVMGIAPGAARSFRMDVTVRT